MFIYDHPALIVTNNFLWIYQLSLFESCWASRWPSHTEYRQNEKNSLPSNCLFHSAVYYYQMTALAATLLCSTRVKLQDRFVSLLWEIVMNLSSCSLLQWGHLPNTCFHTSWNELSWNVQVGAKFLIYMRNDSLTGVWTFWIKRKWWENTTLVSKACKMAFSLFICFTL